MDSLLTAKEACAVLRIGRNRLYAYVNSGQLKASRVGNKWVFKQEWLDQFLQKRTA